MKILDERRRQTIDRAIVEARESDTADTAKALKKLLERLEESGLSEMVDLDIYFGDMSEPLAKETAILENEFGASFTFFVKTIEGMREEIQMHFETTEVYEDEEFAQLEEDIAMIKKEAQERFWADHREDFDRFVDEAIERLSP